MVITTHFADELHDLLGWDWPKGGGEGEGRGGEGRGREGRGGGRGGEGTGGGRGGDGRGEGRGGEGRGREGRGGDYCRWLYMVSVFVSNILSDVNFTVGLSD